MNKLRQLYEKISAASTGLGWNEKAMILSVIIFVTPALYFYWIYPWHNAALKKADRELKQSKNKFERLDAERKSCESMKAEMEAGTETIKFINGLILNPDDAIQIINVISGLIDKNGLAINFIKNSAQFDRVYEKRHAAVDDDGQSDPASKMSCKILPLEFVFRAKPLDFLSFINILEGFKNLNFNIKRINASRSNDGFVDANVIMEIVTELNLNIPSKP